MRVAQQPADEELEREIIDALVRRRGRSRRVDSIQRSMMRSRTARIVAASQSCGLATIGSLPME